MDFSRREVSRRAGDSSQLLGVRECVLEGGRARGVRAIDVRSGSGLEFTVLPDRGMDIAWLSLRGTNLAYIGSAGVVGPAFYDERGQAWLRGFYGGFLTTCGLRNVGSPCSDGGEEFGLHGRESYCPAEAVAADLDWASSRIVVSGRMREARLFGENLVLSRRITVPCGSDSLVIEDRVENLGFREEALTLLYHFNLGYPLLDEGSRFLCPASRTAASGEEAIAHAGDWSSASAPAPGFRERFYVHELKADARGSTRVAMVNEAIGIGVELRFDVASLPLLGQWKMMGEGDYVMGIEPCNCSPRGRATSREAGLLDRVGPGESRDFRVEARFLAGAAALDEVAAEIAKL